jgi:hypothetical protein
MILSYINPIEDEKYMITNIILVVVNGISFIFIILAGISRIFSKLSWSLLDNTIWFFAIYIIISSWISFTILLTGVSQNLMKINLFLYLLSQLAIYLVGILFLFIWIRLYHNYSGLGVRGSEDILAKSLTLISIISIPFILLAIATAISIDTSIFCLRLAWGYLGVCGLALMFPFSYYGYLIIKNNRSMGIKTPKHIYILWLTTTLNIPVAIVSLVIYLIFMEYIDTVIWMSCYIQLSEGIGSALMIVVATTEISFKHLKSIYGVRVINNDNC